MLVRPPREPSRQDLEAKAVQENGSQRAVVRSSLVCMEQTNCLCL